MHLILVGLNHKTAPIEIREKLAIPEERLPYVLTEFKSLKTIAECLVLSTCNRSEVYACSSDTAADVPIINKLAEVCAVEPCEFAPNIYVHRGHKVAEHLFRVASGIDSMVIGEQQILGQVKAAYSVASQSNSTGPLLNTLFQHAIAVGKKARTETDICKGAFSVGSVAVQLACTIFESLNGRSVLVIGAGKMAELSIRHLSSCGQIDLLVANRTVEKAQALANTFHGRPIPFERLASALQHVDIAIASTGSEKPIITRDLMLSVMHARRGRPIFLIDIAVPRDIEVTVGNLDNVFLYNIDDLQQVLTASAVAREAEITKVEALVRAQVNEFMRWFRSLDAAPIITAIREKYERIGEAEINRLRRKLGHLPEREWDIIRSSMRSLINRLCHDPIIHAKEYSQSEDKASKLQVLRELFGLEEGEEERDD